MITIMQRTERRIVVLIRRANRSIENVNAPRSWDQPS
jgi:hypothetical protein